MKKILVVDDNLDTRELTHLHLTTEGFTVIIAADAREGLYMAGVEHPDLIITDISMPGFTGIDMIKELRQQPDLANIPIIVLTAFGREEMDDDGDANARARRMRNYALGLVLGGIVVLFFVMTIVLAAPGLVFILWDNLVVRRAGVAEPSA